MTREVTDRDGSYLVLREPKPIAPPPAHKCVVYHTQRATRSDWKAIIQCTCGKRYKCREEFAINGYVWVRRLLPWPPRQSWPKAQNT